CGSSSPADKLTAVLCTFTTLFRSGGRRSDRLTAGNLSPGNFGLLQHNRPIADIGRLETLRCSSVGDPFCGRYFKASLVIMTPSHAFGALGRQPCSYRHSTFSFSRRAAL